MRRVILVLLIFLVSAAGVSAQTAGQFSAETEVQNEFPRALIFRLTAESDVELTDARLFFRPAGSSFWSSQPVEVTPGKIITAEYEWFTQNQVLPPNLPLEYRWRVRDANGNSYESSLEQVEFLDTRFDWKRISNAQLTLMWYDGDQTWGEEMFATAQQALDEIQADLGVDLEKPVRIVVYGNKQDFQSAFPPQQAWIGGQAFPDMSITVQIIAAGESSWMSEVIPHEVSHLVFHRATESALADPPSWLDEGLAQYYEPGTLDTDEVARLRSAAENGELLPFSRLQGNFGADHGAVSLAYLQSWGLVDFLVRDCGRDGLQGIITELNDDRSVDEALSTACAYTSEQLYARWLDTELGVTPPATPAPEKPQPEPTTPAVSPDEQQPEGDEQAAPPAETPSAGIPVRLILGFVAVGAAFVALLAGGLAIALFIIKR